MINTVEKNYDLLDVSYFNFMVILFRILESLGYKMSSNAGHNKLCKEFASQLETHGLWHWAVFVLLHIQDPGMNKRCTSYSCP